MEVPWKEVSRTICIAILCKLITVARKLSHRTCFCVYCAMLVTSTKAVTFTILELSGTDVSTVGAAAPA